MNRQTNKYLHGVLLDSRTTLTIDEFCRACGAEKSLVIEMVAEGVIEPLGTPPELSFRGDALMRAHRAVRLVRDLHVNLPGAALALDLLDELESIRG